MQPGVVESLLHPGQMLCDVSEFYFTNIYIDLNTKPTMIIVQRSLFALPAPGRQVRKRQRHSQGIRAGGFAGLGPNPGAT